MSKTKRILFTAIFLFTIGTMFVSCDNFEGSQTVPAYLRIDSMDVVSNPDITSIPFYQQNSGFLTSNIPSVRIAINGKNLGVFDLPCSVPVLREGKCNLTIDGVIKQNGMAATRIYYPFYETITLNNIEFTSGKETSLDNPLHLKYATYSNFKWLETFESPSSGFDTITTTCVDPNIVKWGSSCGSICYNGTAGSSVETRTKDSIPITSTNAEALYLEIDYMTNTYFSVGMEGYSSEQSKTINMSAIRLKPTDGAWKKIYILLGKVWPQMGRPENVKLVFSISSEDNVEGAKVYFDNIKVVSY